MKMHSPLHPGQLIRHSLDCIKEEKRIRPTIG